MEAIILLKGVNKRVIEITRPEDHYFEKVIFFLSPQASSDQFLIQKHTAEMLDSALPKMKRKKSRFKARWKLLFALTGAAASGAALSILLSGLQ